MSEYAKSIQTIEDMWKKRIELRDGGGRMSEYIINTSQIEEINKAHYGMKIVTSWLSCYAIWDTSYTPPLMKSEHIAVTLPGIVRCRDCKYYIDSDLFYSPFCSFLNDHDTQPDGFCAWGEREDGDAR